MRFRIQNPKSKIQNGITPSMMRYLFLSLLVPAWLFSQPLIAAAVGEDLSSQSASAPNPEQNFWLLSQQLVQDEMYLVDRIELALQDPDPNQVRAVRGQLTLHVFAVERFLRSQNSTPDDLCRHSRQALTTDRNPISTPNSGLRTPDSTQSQMQVYCSLSASSQKLLALGPVLDRQLQERGDLAPVGPLPLVSGERQSDSRLPIAVIQRPNLGVPATPFFAPAPSLPPAEPSIGGRVTKTPIANYVPPMQPAIAPPPEALPTIQAVKQLLASIRAAFPLGTRFVKSGIGSAYDPQASEYAKFLALSHTGIARMLPDEDRPSPNTLRNRSAPAIAERLPLKMAAGHFQVAESGVDYGFLVDLRDIPLEKLDPRLQVVSPRTRQFFLTYQSPKQLEALQVDRRRFLTGKLEGFNLSEPLLGQAPVVMNHTYLVRSLQFQLPKVIMTGEPVSRRERRYLDQLLEMKSSDLLFAFRPVSRHPDGSYTILWQVLRQFPAPQIDDLEKYVRLE